MRTMNGHEKHLSLDLNLLITRTDFYLVVPEMPAMPGYSIVQTCAQGTGQPGHGAQMLYSLQFRQRHLQFPSPKWFHLERKGEHNV